MGGLLLPHVRMADGTVRQNGTQSMALTSGQELPSLSVGKPHWWPNYPILEASEWSRRAPGISGEQPRGKHLRLAHWLRGGQFLKGGQLLTLSPLPDWLHFAWSWKPCTGQLPSEGQCPTTPWNAPPAAAAAPKPCDCQEDAERKREGWRGRFLHSLVRLSSCHCRGGQPRLKTNKPVFDGAVCVAL